MTFKIVTWNVNSIRLRIQHLIEMIEEYQPDIICLQELKCTADYFPEEAIAHLPYNLYICGQKTFNGVAILAKMPADEVITDFPGNPCSQQARFIATKLQTPIGYCLIISLYAPNGSSVGSEKFKIKLSFYDAFINYLTSIKTIYNNIIICADYNVAPLSIDVYDSEVTKNTLYCTDIERTKLQKITDLGFVDNFRLLHPNKQEFTWWDYRQAALARNHGYRIDGIISTISLTKSLTHCIIDRNSRLKSRPSDHAPVISTYGVFSEKN